MKHILALLLSVLLLSFGVGAFAQNFSIWTVLGTNKYLRGEIPAKSTPVKLDAAINEHEAFQIIIKADRKIESASVSASHLRSGSGIIKNENIDLRLAHYIELTKALGGGFGPGFYPDALLPMPSSFSVEQGDTQMIWVNIYNHTSTKPGVYTGYVELKIDGQIHKVPVELRVRDFALSVENHFGSAFALWAGQCAGYYNIPTNSPEFVEMVDKYYWFMVGYRMPPDDLPVSVESPEAARYLNDPRVNSYRIPYNPADPEGFKKRVAHLRNNGWLDKGYVYTIDEPAASEYESCAEYGRQIDSLATDALWLLTAPPHKTMIGTVDIWCPVLSYYNNTMQECMEEQEKGRHVWWYTCVGPQHPYPTYLINDSAVSHRILSWFQAMYKVEGVLYWATSIWDKYEGGKYIKRDLWVDPLAFPGANGDGYLLYPGEKYNDDPIPTLRLELIRQGNEDFETFYILQQRYAKLAKDLGVIESKFDANSRVRDYVGRLGASLTRWEADPVLMENTRRDILDDISQVNSGPKMLVSTSVPEEMLTGKEHVDVRVWVEPGAKVTAKTFTNAGGKIIPLKMVSGGKHLGGDFRIPLDDDSVKLVMSVTKGKSTKVLTRTFRTYSTKKLIAIKGDVVCDWSSQAEVDKWTPRNTSIEIAKSDRIESTAKITFSADVEFPNMLLQYPKGFSNVDWSGKRYMAFTLFNPGEVAVDFIIKGTDRDGKKHDGYNVTVDANESKKVYYDLVDLSRTGVNIKNLSGFEFWMWERSKPATLYFGPVVLTDEKP